MAQVGLLAFARTALEVNRAVLPLSGEGGIAIECLCCEGVAMLGTAGWC